MKRPEPIKKAKNFVQRKRPPIQDVISEPLSGGVVFRRNKKGKIEFLLIQDSKDRWTIPKGHIEEGETARQTAGREVMEETGLKEVRVYDWLGKINFQYRRQNSLVLMTQQIYLVAAKGDTDDIQKEDWMNGIGWHESNKALDLIEYDDISKAMLLGLRKIRELKM